jgi:hypothetical protein
VAVVMVLQHIEGCSDEEAVDRFSFNARWKHSADRAFGDRSGSPRGPRRYPRRSPRSTGSSAASQSE